MVPPIASNFILGNYSPDEIVRRGEELSKDSNITPIFNQLGEHYTDKKEVSKSVNTYHDLIDKIGESNEEIEISVKPTQIGLDISERVFHSNAENIVERCNKNDVFMWFDMEKYETVEPTVNFYLYIADKYPNTCGVCLQSNLRRTRGDIKNISDIDGSKVRLVKGAYNVKERNSTKNTESSFKEYIDIATDRFENDVAVASHDDEILQYAQECSGDVEFQMLKGVRENKQKNLSSEYTVKQYIPYGDKWLFYTYRRIKERPRNIFLIGQSIVDIFGRN